MQPQRSSTTDLAELKTQILKKVGFERFKKYCHYLNRFLSQKLSKIDFDKSCFRLLGGDNLRLHNQLIRSVLKNACQVKTLRPTCRTGTTKSSVQIAKSSPVRDDEHGGSLLPNQNQNVSVWSNGVLPMSPRKTRSGMRAHKPRDRSTGKIECISHQSTVAENNGSKVIADNRELSLCDFQRPAQHLQAVAGQPENKTAGMIQQPSETPRTRSKDQTSSAEDGEEVQQTEHFILFRSPLLAPFGIPFHSANVVGSRKAMPAPSSSDFISFSDGSGLSNTEILRKRMEQIAAAQDVGGVSVECANMLNNMLDAYLKRLIRSSVELVGSRSSHDHRKPQIHKQQVQGKAVKVTWPVIHVQSNSGSVEFTRNHMPHCSVSLLDFKVAMELNPQQLGKDWPLLLEKIYMHASED